MFQESYSIAEKDLHLHFEHGGADLHLIGTHESYLRVQGEGEPEDYQAQWQHGTLSMRLPEDCAFFIPSNLNVKVSGRFGELHINELAGNLSIEGGQGDVVINAATGHVQLDRVGGDLKATTAGSLSVAGRIAGDALIADVAGAVSLAEVAGDLQVDGAGALQLSGDVAGSAKIADVGGEGLLQEVAGSLVVRDVADMRVSEVRGDLRASDVHGDFHCAGIGGDAKLQGVTGKLTLQHVGGDAHLRDIAGMVGALSVGGDLRLQLELQTGQEYELTAGGDIVLSLTEDAAARLECVAGGEVVDRISGERFGPARGLWRHVIGEGGPLVKMRAGGDIKIKSEEEGSMEFRAEIGKEEMQRAKEEIKRAKEEIKRIKRELKDQLRAQRQEIRYNVRAGLAGGMGKGFEAAFRHRGPRPPRGPRGARSFKFSFDPFNFEFGGKAQRKAGPSASAIGVSEEERMAILKMLEEKKITPEQAEMLLNALGDEWGDV